MTISQTMHDAINYFYHANPLRISIAEFHFEAIGVLRYSPILTGESIVCIWHIKPKPKQVQYGITIWSNLTKEVPND